MTETRRSGIYVAAAAACALAAWLIVPQRAGRRVPTGEGQALVEDFAPEAVADVELVEAGRVSDQPHVVRVARRGASWVLLSHDAFPAAGPERVAALTAMLQQTVRGELRSTREVDFATFGVADPRRIDTAGSPGDTGTRVILRDDEGQTLADLIVGRPVEGRRGHFHVRATQNARTYVARLDATLLRTELAVWAPYDWLQMAGARVVGLRRHPYRAVREDGAVRVTDAEPQILRRSEEAWKTEDGRDAPNDEALRRTLTALRRLALVDVHHAGDEWGEWLDAARRGRLDEARLAQVRSVLGGRGLHLAGGDGGRLVARRGELTAQCDDGVVVRLLFGASVPGETFAPDTPDAVPQEHRALRVEVSYDAELLGPPPTPPQRGQVLDQPDADYELARAQYEKALAAWQQRRDNGQRRLRSLQARTADWLFVLKQDVYEALTGE